MEAELNENCPTQLYPAIGIRAHGSGTVSVCIMDPSNWNSEDNDAGGKHAQVVCAPFHTMLTGYLTNPVARNVNNYYCFLNRLFYHCLQYVNIC